MPKTIIKDFRKWLYHDDCPQGQLFDNPDLEAMFEEGWVTSPAKLDIPEFVEEVEELTEEQVKGFRPEDMIARVKNMGYEVLTPEQLEAEQVKYAASLPAVTPLVLADFCDHDLLKEALERGIGVPSDPEPIPEEPVSTPTLSDRFNEDPKSLTIAEHLELGKELGMVPALRKTWSEPVLIEKITAKLNEGQ